MVGLLDAYQSRPEGMEAIFFETSKRYWNAVGQGRREQAAIYQRFLELNNAGYYLILRSRERQTFRHTPDQVVRRMIQGDLLLFVSRSIPAANGYWLGRGNRWLVVSHEVVTELIERSQVEEDHTYVDEPFHLHYRLSDALRLQQIQVLKESMERALLLSDQYEVEEAGRSADAIIGDLARLLTSNVPANLAGVHDILILNALVKRPLLASEDSTE